MYNLCVRLWENTVYLDISCFIIYDCFIVNVYGKYDTLRCVIKTFFYEKNIGSSIQHHGVFALESEMGTNTAAST